ncbi:MAG: TetR/AcrR family transcriptional regulator [Pseudomonadota bacterium]
MSSSARTTPAPATARPGRARLPKVVMKPAAKKPAAQSKTKPDRKADILLAAEKLFAKHGYHAVSIRQIADEAGVPLALVGYHYGPKHELFYAIFQHWNSTIEERLQALRGVTIDPDDEETLPRIIDAFTGPVLRMRASAEGEYYALLVARELFIAQKETDRVLRNFFDPLANAFIDALRTLMPHATRGQVAWGYQFTVGTLLHHISDYRVERLSGGESIQGDPAAATMLGRYIVGGLRAALAPVNSPLTVSPSPKPRNVKTRKRQA